MKTYLIILSLLSSFCLFSQIKTDSIQYHLQPVKPNFNWNKKTDFFNFNQLDLYTKTDFSVYNRATLMNDNYSFYNGKFEYKNSILIPENMFFNPKLDSFNPNGNGTIEFGTSLIIGILNLAEGLFQSK